MGCQCLPFGNKRVSADNAKKLSNKGFSQSVPALSLARERAITFHNVSAFSSFHST